PPRPPSVEGKESARALAPAPALGQRLSLLVLGHLPLRAPRPGRAPRGFPAPRGTAAARPAPQAGLRPAGELLPPERSNAAAGPRPRHRPGAAQRRPARRGGTGPRLG